MISALKEAERLIYKYEWLVFILLVAIWMIPVWANRYFVTLDGPSHVYNSFVVLEFLKHHDTDFWGRFYILKNQFNPNWFSHLTLAFLLNFFSPEVAEKILVSIYVLLFSILGRALVTRINPANKMFSYLLLLFAFTHVFQMGFYNFSFGLVFMMGSLWFYIKYHQRMETTRFILAGVAVFMLTYIAHPMGYLIAVGTTAGYLFLNAAFTNEPLKHKFTSLLKSATAFTLIILPSFAFFLYFIFVSSPEPASGVRATGKELYDLLTSFTGILNMVEAEEPFTKIAFSFFEILLLVGIVVRVFTFRLAAYDIFLVISAALMWFYFSAPASFAGGGMINDRLQILPVIPLICWFASLNYPRWFQIPVAATAVSLSLCLLVVRLPVHRQASLLVEEYQSTEKYIKPYSTVLPLSYAHNGKTTDGKLLTNRTWIFFHSADYMGAGKPLIMCGNYEANTPFFPLSWAKNKSPFNKIATNSGIEGCPPSADLLHYKEKSGEELNYVILLCLDDEYRNHPYTQDILMQLDSGFTHIYTSANGRAILYQRKQ